MKEQYIVLGAGGHAKVVIDILQLNQNNIYGLTDEQIQMGDMCTGYPVLGTDVILDDIYKQGIHNAVMGIGHVGNYKVRNNVYQKAKNIGYIFPNIIHPQAILARSVQLGEGNLLAVRSVVNPEVLLGNLCIVNTAAVIEHEVKIGDGVHIAPQATVLGGVHIGDNTFVGAGSIILQGVNVGRNCIIGAGCIVRENVEDNCVIVGNPGKVIRRR